MTQVRTFPQSRAIALKETEWGVAITERWLAATFNQTGHAIVDHRTYVIASDGDLMEGITSEAASLAGDLHLGRLIVFYDANHITLSATTNVTFSEDVRAARFAAYGWQVQTVDGMGVAAVDGALTAARADEQSAVAHRGAYAHRIGSPNKHDTFEAHGEPLGTNEVRLTKRAYGWPEDAAFRVPEEAQGAFDEVRRADRRCGAPGSRRWMPIAPRMVTSPVPLTARSRANLPRGSGRQASPVHARKMAIWPPGMPGGG